MTYPSHERSYQLISKFISEVNPIQVRKVGQVVSLLVLVINYTEVTSYTREDEFPSHTQLLPLLRN